MFLCNKKMLQSWWKSKLKNDLIEGIRFSSVMISKKTIHMCCTNVLSRLGHMSYDVGAHILQTGIPSSKANLIGTTEASVASLVESIMLGIVIIVNDVSHFEFLPVLSLSFNAIHQ